MHLLKRILFPLSILYGFVVYLRNRFYDFGLLRSVKPVVPTVVVGNLSFGGTGKTPMILWLLHHVFDPEKVAVLSRGYGRNSNGFKWVASESDAIEVGDEPLQIKKEFPSTVVAVCENRVEGITEITKQFQPEVIILDDAFQHRKIRASRYILLSTYTNPFYNDCHFPAGSLRDHRSEASRADLVILTKCSPSMEAEEAEAIRKRVSEFTAAPVYFAALRYFEFTPAERLAFSQSTPVLVTGIANPEPLLDFLNSQNIPFEHLRFKDHMHYTAQEITQISRYSHLITTEKDYVKLQPLLLNSSVQVHIVRVAHSILFDQSIVLKEQLLTHTPY